MASAKRASTRISLRAGTDLTYNLIRGSYTSSKTLADIEYMRPEGEVYLAISLNTGATALGDTLENAYSSLILKLYNYLRDVMDTPGVEIGQDVSEELRKESSHASRMPFDRQFRALNKGINDFIESHKGSTSFRSRIQCDPTQMITTPGLDDTDIRIDAFVEDTSTCAAA
jgi:hypothetical protein